MQIRWIIAIIFLVTSIVILLNPSDYITGFITRTGQLSIGNAVPVVDAVYLNEQLAASNPTDVTINPAENTTKNVTVKITMEDANGNCNTFTNNNGTAFFCNGTAECDASKALYSVMLVYNSTDGQWGTGNKYCNMSGTAPALFQFYEINGTWTVNVTVSDGVANSTANAKNWTYGELAAFSYAPGGTVNMGNLNLETWNNGTGQQQARNTGNIILDVAWNATNFTGQTYGDTLNITGSNYIIDDDALGSDDTENIPQRFINESQEIKVTFVPDSGLLRCTSPACANTNSTYEVYWHIYLQAGLKQDTYTNSIEVTSTYHS